MLGMNLFLLENKIYHTSVIFWLTYIFHLKYGIPAVRDLRHEGRSGRGVKVISSLLDELIC